MHESTARLYLAAKLLAGVEGQSRVASRLNESPQTVKNWEARGVSAEGAIKAEAEFGCRAAWIRYGTGSMECSPGVAAGPAVFSTGEVVRPAVQAPQVDAIEQCVRTLANTVSKMSPLRWSAVSAILAQLPSHPEMRDDVAEELLLLLRAEPGKRTGTA